MNYKSLLFCLLLFTNCEDRKTSKEMSNPKAKDSIKVENETESKAQSNNSDDNFKLTEANAMEFFMSYDNENPEDKVRIYTRFGDIDLELFKETNFHRANFIFLTKEQYFDGTQFHRVVNNFIIQGGNTDNPVIGKKRGDIGRYLIPKDTRHGFKHHRGIVSVPSSEIDNPFKLASPYEFFIVQAPKGAYHLDGDYTAFGKVINGMDVVDKIAAQTTDKAEWPLRNIIIDSVRIID
jgi:cyclophilin family peptidyl-prolyl cis-trans isomerase